MSPDKPIEAACFLPQATATGHKKIIKSTANQNKPPLLVTAAVIIENGRVLITRRPDHKPQGGLWEFPGGKINPGESPVDALKREIREELALDIQVGAIMDVLFHHYAWGPVLLLVYSCQREGGTPRNIEVSEHCWVPLADLANYRLLAADQPLVDKLCKQGRCCPQNKT